MRAVNKVHEITAFKNRSSSPDDKEMISIDVAAKSSRVNDGSSVSGRQGQASHPIENLNQLVNIWL